VKPISSWAGAKHDGQVPSVVSIEPEAYGYDANGLEETYVWTKLLLDKHVTKKSFDDGGLSYSSIYGPGFMTTPMEMSPQQLVTKYLKFLHEKTIAELESLLTPGFVRSSPIEFWFTTPAIWSAKAMEATKEAAQKAGFGPTPSRPNDKLHLIKEPEAAAIACLSECIVKGPDARVQVRYIIQPPSDQSLITLLNPNY
jgi:molecular chaperone DnaK (HSP70)